MASKYHEIKDLLARHERCFQELHTLQMRERESLASLDMEALQAGNNRKETLALQIRALDDSRTRMCADVARERGVDPAEVTLSFLCAHCEPELRDDFARLAERFRTLAGELDATVRANKRLVQSSLDTARNMEQMLRRLISDQPTYTSRGELTDPRPRRRAAIGTL